MRLPDWLLLAGNAMAMAFLLLLHWRMAFFASMFRDFGAGQLPCLTRLSIHPAAGCISAGGMVALLVIGWLSGRKSRRARRAWFVVSMVFSLVVVAIVLAGLYLPIFDLAGKIKGD